MRKHAIIVQLCMFTNEEGIEFKLNTDRYKNGDNKLKMTISNDGQSHFITIF